MHTDNLFLAIERGDLAALGALVATGADVDEVDLEQYQASPLAHACARGDDAAVRYLLAAGANPDAAAYAPPLVAAAMYGFADTLALLLTAGAQANAADENGASALWHAAARGFADIVQTLIAAGADPFQANNDGVPPTQAAAESGHSKLAAYLENPASSPTTPAQWRGSSKKSREVASARYAALQQPEAPEPEEIWQFDKGMARSQYVTQDFPSLAASGKLALAQAMLDAGLDPDWTLFDGHATALMQAARAGELEMLELLLARGAKVTQTTEKGLTALHMALFKPSARRHAPVVERLLRAGANPDAADDTGQRPLQMALRHAIPPLVEALLKGGANPLLRDPAGRTVADWAPTSGKHAATIRALLDAASR
ncbi:MAG: ankyrin repeat domain-containing protein [Pseudomonadota bacterium]